MPVYVVFPAFTHEIYEVKRDADLVVEVVVDDVLGGCDEHIV